MTACVDSDVLIDYFNGIEAVSRISWMEVLVGAPDQERRKTYENFLRRFQVFELDERVARDAIALRQQYRLKLPDAIIWASARLNSALLVTRNAEDFPAQEPGIRVPYRVSSPG
jgi:predicted nucleic acid-binding protein